MRNIITLILTALIIGRAEAAPNEPLSSLPSDITKVSLDAATYHNQYFGLTACFPDEGWFLSIPPPSEDDLTRTLLLAGKFDIDTESSSAFIIGTAVFESPNPRDYLNHLSETLIADDLTALSEPMQFGSRSIAGRDFFYRSFLVDYGVPMYQTYYVCYEKGLILYLITIRAQETETQELDGIIYSLRFGDN